MKHSNYMPQGSISDKCLDKVQAEIYISPVLAILPYLNHASCTLSPCKLLSSALTIYLNCPLLQLSNPCVLIHCVIASFGVICFITTRSRMIGY